jgi:hypothetical protein
LHNAKLKISVYSTSNQPYRATIAGIEFAPLKEISITALRLKYRVCEHPHECCEFPTIARKSIFAMPVIPVSLIFKNASISGQNPTVSRQKREFGT